MTTPAKFVKALEFGAPKTGKTKNTVETCPKPALIFSFEAGGTDCVTAIPITGMTSGDFRAKMVAKSKDWPAVTVLEYLPGAKRIGEGKTETFDKSRLEAFIKDFNLLFDHMPFRTVIADSFTGMDTVSMAFILGLNKADTAQIQHYGQLQTKKEAIISALMSLPCNVVVLAHEEAQKDELTGAIRILPFGTGKFQEKMGMYFSQVVYRTVSTDTQGNPKYEVWTAPRGLVKGLGLRFPQGKKPVVGPTWKDIYE